MTLQLMHEHARFLSFLDVTLICIQCENGLEAFASVLGSDKTTFIEVFAWKMLKLTSSCRRKHSYRPSLLTFVLFGQSVWMCQILILSDRYGIYAIRYCACFAIKFFFYRFNSGRFRTE